MRILSLRPALVLGQQSPGATRRWHPGSQQADPGRPEAGEDACVVRSRSAVSPVPSVFPPPRTPRHSASRCLPPVEAKASSTAASQGQRATRANAAVPLDTASSSIVAWHTGHCGTLRRGRDGHAVAWLSGDAGGIACSALPVAKPYQYQRQGTARQSSRGNRVPVVAWESRACRRVGIACLSSRGNRVPIAADPATTAPHESHPANPTPRIPPCGCPVQNPGRALRQQAAPRGSTAPFELDADNPCRRGRRWLRRRTLPRPTRQLALTVRPASRRA